MNNVHNDLLIVNDFNKIDIEESLVNFLRMLKIIFRFNGKINEKERRISFENDVFKISFGNRHEFEYKKENVKIGWGRKLQEGYLYENDLEKIDNYKLKKIVLYVVKSLLDENLISFNLESERIILCRERIYFYDIENYVGLIKDLLEFTGKLENTCEFENELMFFRRYEGECKCNDPEFQVKNGEDYEYDDFECRCNPEAHVFIKELNVRIYFNNYLKKVNYQEIKEIALSYFMESTKKIIGSII